MRGAPGAEIDDGRFQVVILGDLSRLESMKVLRIIYGGRHLGLPTVDRHWARQISARLVHPDDQVLLDLDGEQPGRLPGTWNVHPRAIQLKI